ncbi:MAG: hypothetical protein ACOYU7_03730 [Bacillota bacterium]|jgi:hypothetical protein|uniref:hypothetical protein n=1 Tax=unclassified Candidatus Desulforudis TaxID=2635950 RepID=UPI003493EEB2
MPDGTLTTLLIILLIGGGLWLLFRRNALGVRPGTGEDRRENRGEDRGDRPQE